jgi:serine/threonine-protein kinase
LKQLLERCLDRDPKTRLRDIGEARIAIARSLNGAANETVSLTQKRSSVAWVIATVLAMPAAGTSWMAWRAMQPAALRPLTKLNVDLGAEVSLPGSGGADVILSPDDTRMVYVSQARLFTRRLDQADVTQLAGTDGAFAPFFSPDGQWVAFFAQGKLKKVPVQGGAAVALCDYQFNPKGGSWDEDGTIVASLIAGGAGLSRIPQAGGAPTPLTELAEGETTHRWPQILPGGKAVLFTAHSSGIAGFDDANIVVMSLGNRRTKTLVHGGTFARFLPSGHLIYVSRGTLFAVPFDLDALEVHGQPIPVIEQVAYSSRDGSAQFDVARNGRVSHRSDTRPDTPTVRRNRKGRATKRRRFLFPEQRSSERRPQSTSRVVPCCPDRYTSGYTGRVSRPRYARNSRVLA